DRLATAEKERIERLPLPSREVVIVRQIRLDQRILFGEVLEVMADLMGDRLEDLFLPVPVGILAAELEEGPVVERDGGAYLGPEVGWIVLGEAFTEGEDVGEGRMEDGPAGDVDPVDALLVGGRDLIEHGAGPGGE